MSRQGRFSQLLVNLLLSILSVPTVQNFTVPFQYQIVCCILWQSNQANSPGSKTLRRRWQLIVRMVGYGYRSK